MRDQVWIEMRVKDVGDRDVARVVHYVSERPVGCDEAGEHGSG